MAREIEITSAHWLKGTGAVGLIDEVVESRKVCGEVYRILQANKVPSTYYSDNISKNRTQNVNHLIAHHNADNNGVVVSIHFNASNGTVSGPIGVEVLYYDEKKLASDLSSAISKASGLKNRGAKQRKDLGILARTKEPAVLIEVCFVNSKTDVSLYQSKFNEICQAIAEVLASRIGKNISANKTNMSKPTQTAVASKTARVKSGLYNSQSSCQNAVSKAGRLGILSPKWATYHQVKDGRWYFISGTYQSTAQAESAIAKMKANKILYVATVI